MKKNPLIAVVLLLLALPVRAQNWDTLPGFNAHVHNINWFYDDTATSKLIAYGNFDTLGNVPAQSIAAWDGNSWGTIIPQLTYPPSITTVLRYNGNLLIGGYIPSWDLNRSYIATWNGTILDSFASFKGGSPDGMLTYQNDLIVYGFFDTIQGVPVQSLARWNGTNWSDLGYGAFSVDVDKMIVYHGDLYAAGISSIDQKDYVFRLVNNNTWQPIGQSFNGATNVLDLCVYNNELYAGGCFSVNDNPSSPGNAIAKLDTVSDTWTNVGGGLTSVSIAPFSEVGHMTVHNGSLYCMGWFDHAGGAYAPMVVKWDGTQWCGFGIGWSYTLNTIVDYNNTLYLATGPVFNNDTSTGFVKWIGGNYTDTCGVVTTGINEITQQNFSVLVSPNPASDVIAFQTENSIEEIIITDQLGREVRRQKINGEKQIEISVSNLANGMYFYQVVEKDNIGSSGKFIVQH